MQQSCVKTAENRQVSKVTGNLILWFALNYPVCCGDGSPLEFYLRKEEFLAMVLAGQQIQALEFAREHLAPIAAVDSNQLMRLMGALAFPNLRDAPQEYAAAVRTLCSAAIAPRLIIAFVLLCLSILMWPDFQPCCPTTAGKRCTTCFGWR